MPTDSRLVFALGRKHWNVAEATGMLIILAVVMSSRQGTMEITYKFGLLQIHYTQNFQCLTSSRMCLAYEHTHTHIHKYTLTHIWYITSRIMENFL